MCSARTPPHCTHPALAPAISRHSTGSGLHTSHARRPALTAARYQRPPGTRGSRTAQRHAARSIAAPAVDVQRSADPSDDDHTARPATEQGPQHDTGSDTQHAMEHDVVARSDRHYSLLQPSGQQRDDFAMLWCASHMQPHLIPQIASQLSLST